MELVENLKVDGAIEEEARVDERMQAVLHAELVDFFMYYDLLNYRLRWLLSQYQFKDFSELKNYYDTYIIPRLDEQKDEDNKNIHSGSEQ